MTTVALVAHWDWVLYNYRLPLVRALRDRGAEVMLVCPSGRYVDRLAAEAEWIEWSVDRPGMHPVTELRSVSALTELYRERRPDLVQHFGLKPNLYGSIAAKRAGVGGVVNTFTGLGYLFSDDPRAARLRTFLVPLLRSAARRANGWAVVLTPDDLAVLERARLVDPARASIVAEGIDATAFTPRSHRDDGAEPVVFLAGRLLWDKGLAELVDAATRLHQRDVRVRVVVAGEPDVGNPASVPGGQIEEWQRGGHVEFLGQRSDVPDLLRGSDIAVLPSYHEGLPRFLLESAAAGLAIVASDIPGCRAIVEHEKNGLLVPPRDAIALSDAISRLATDVSLRARLGDAARRTVVERFDESALVQQQLEVYAEVGLQLG